MVLIAISLGGFEIARNGKPSPRTRTTRQTRVDLARLADMYVKGMTWERMAKELGVSVSQIGYDLQKVREMWKQRTTIPIDEQRKQIMQTLALVAEEAWGGWERSRQEAVKRIHREVAGGPNGSMTTDEEVREEQAGDPRFLQVVQNTQEQLRRILGVDSPSQVDVTSGGERVKSYVTVSPDDWDKALAEAEAAKAKAKAAPDPEKKA